MEFASLILPELENQVEFDYMKVLGLSPEQERLLRRQEINRLKTRLLEKRTTPLQTNENGEVEEEESLPSHAEIL